MTDFSRNISVVKDILRRLSAVFRGDMNVNILVSTRIEPETFGMIDQRAVCHATLALNFKSNGL